MNLPACDSAPGLEPKPPSKFKHDLTKSAALSTFNSDNLPKIFLLLKISIKIN